MLDQSQSPLFALPPELREYIYTLALTANRPITDPFNSKDGRPSVHKDIAVLGLGLLRTCRKVHSEVKTNMFYEANVFRFTEPKTALAFFSSLPPHQHKLIRGFSCDFRSVELAERPKWWVMEWKSAWTFQAGLGPTFRSQAMPPNLEWLGIDITFLQTRCESVWSEHLVEHMRTALRECLIGVISAHALGDIGIKRVYLIGIGKDGMSTYIPISTTGTFSELLSILNRCLDSETGRLIPDVRRG